MENQFFVDSEYLSPEALAKKHRIENDPASRKNHMEYLPGIPIAGICVVSAIMKAESPKTATIELKARAKELGII